MTLWKGFQDNDVFFPYGTFAYFYLNAWFDLVVFLDSGISPNILWDCFNTFRNSFDLIKGVEHPEPQHIIQEALDPMCRYQTAFLTW